MRKEIHRYSSIYGSNGKVPTLQRVGIIQNPVLIAHEGGQTDRTELPEGFYLFFQTYKGCPHLPAEGIFRKIQ